MPFTAEQIENIANAAIDYHMEKGRVASQSIQNKPLLAAMRAKEKTFPGGKDLITLRVKGEYNDDFIAGFEHDDSVGYDDEGHIKTASFAWKLHHGGIKFSMHELLKDGISVVDSADGKSTVQHSDREMTALAGILADHLEHADESWDRSHNLLYWRDGTADPKMMAGIRAYLLDNPDAAGTIAGIDPAANTWWKNRAFTATSSNGAIDSSTASNQNLVTTLQKEFRQLRRFGSPRHMILAGSDWMDAFEQELRAKGNYTLEGWAKSGRIDASVADLMFKGVPIDYDPTLDDESLAKYAFVIDTKAFMPMVIEGESMKKHSPARPEDKYVFYRAWTWVGCLVCRQRNTSGIYAIQ